MRYSIITPTIVRPTLKRLCDSIDSQTNGDWEHLVIVDSPEIPKVKTDILDSVGRDPRRRFFNCPVSHSNFGNTCRHDVIEHAEGEYVLYIDDDDFYADDQVLETLEEVTGDWAIFPVLAYGKRCFSDPPAIHKTGSAMFIHRRDTGCRFPVNGDYSGDGQLVEELKLKFNYQSLPHVRPLVIYEQANRGRDF